MQQNYITTFNNLKADKIEAKFKKRVCWYYRWCQRTCRTHWDNSGQISHQREHFAMLSKDVNDLIKIFERHKIYRDYCPMYDQGKMVWISDQRHQESLLWFWNVNMWWNYERVVSWRFSKKNF
jgi:hypothetical protein